MEGDFFLFNLFLVAKAEILKTSFVGMYFGQNDETKEDISKLTDLHQCTSGLST